MKILNLDNWCPEALEILSNFNPFHTSKLYDAADMIHVYKDFEGIISNLSIKMDEKRLKYFPNLKFIASPTTGLDHIDLDYCKSKGIDIISLQGETEFLKDVHATSEMAWALIMALIRKVPFAHNHVIEGGWEREKFRGTELHGKTLGIVGCGRVGNQVAQTAGCFGMELIYTDSKYRWCYPLKQLLQESDIATIHVDLNESTKNLFSYEQFKLMKPTAYFVNTSRGAIVDEEALIWALENKVIAGAALDVVQGEPRPWYESDLWPRLLHYASKHDNLILTPHISGNTAESRKSTQLFIANKIKEYIKNSKESET